jgi:hypothetical protein
MKTINNRIGSSGDISRRNFVKTAASGAAALTILPNVTVSGLGHVTPSDKLLIAAVGCGGEAADDIRHYAIAPTEVSCSASTVYNGIFTEGLYPESGPVSSSIRFKYELKNGKNLDLYWMDGGITPERPYEIDPDVNMNEVMADYPGLNDYEGGTLFIGTKGKAACGWGGRNPILLPISKNKEISVPQKYSRITGDMDGHWWQ